MRRVRVAQGAFVALILGFMALRVLNFRSGSAEAVLTAPEVAPPLADSASMGEILTEPALTARSAVPEGKVVTHAGGGALDATTRESRSKGIENPYTLRLPSSLDQWLADPQFNVEEFRDCNPSASNAYEGLVVGLTAVLGEFQASHQNLRETVGSAKLDQGIDLVDRTAPFPTDAMVRHSRSSLQAGGGIVTQTTFVRHGDSVELDDLDIALKAHISESLAAIQRLVRANCK